MFWKDEIECISLQNIIFTAAHSHEKLITKNEMPRTLWCNVSEVADLLL